MLVNSWCLLSNLCGTGARLNCRLPCSWMHMVEALNYVILNLKKHISRSALVVRGVRPVGQHCQGQGAGGSPRCRQCVVRTSALTKPHITVPAVGVLSVPAGTCRGCFRYALACSISNGRPQGSYWLLVGQLRAALRAQAQPSPPPPRIPTHTPLLNALCTWYGPPRCDHCRYSLKSHSPLAGVEDS